MDYLFVILWLIVGYLLSRASGFRFRAEHAENQVFHLRRQIDGLNKKIGEWEQFSESLRDVRAGEYSRLYDGPEN